LPPQEFDHEETINSTFPIDKMQKTAIDQKHKMVVTTEELRLQEI